MSGGSAGAGDARFSRNGVRQGAAVTPGGGSVTITGTLNSTPGETFALDFYRSVSADPSGFGQPASVWAIEPGGMRFIQHEQRTKPFFKFNHLA